MENWKDVFHLTKKLSFISQGSTWTYMKDVLWPNCKKCKAAKTGNNEKPSTTSEVLVTDLTSSDDIRLEMVTTDADKHEVGTVIQFKCDDQATCTTDKDPRVVDSSKPVTKTRASNDSGLNSPVRGQKKQRSGTRKVIQKESSEVRQKRRLMIKHIQLLNHKLRLEIALLEKQLDLPLSIHSRQVEESDDTQRNHGSG